MVGPERGPAHTALTVEGFTALVLAGSRRDGDALARSVGVSHKALAPVAGVPMLTRVVSTLHAARSVRRVIVCGLDRQALLTQPDLHAFLDRGLLALVPSQSTPSASVLSAMQELAPCTPLLIATADHPLLTTALVDDFCTRSARSGADVTVGLVAADLVHAAFPTLRRTRLPFRDGAYHGCNLYAFLTPIAQRAPAAWMEVERHRKRPWRMINALGPGVTLRFLLRRLTVEAETQLASDRMQVHIRPIFLSQPEAGFDIDTSAQLQAAEAFLRARERRNATPLI